MSLLCFIFRLENELLETESKRYFTGARWLDGSETLERYYAQALLSNASDLKSKMLRQSMERKHLIIAKGSAVSESKYA